MPTTELSNQEFDLAAYLLSEAYGPMQEDGQRLQWTMQDSIDLAHDFALDGITADPEEILALMQEFDRQDSTEAVTAQL